MFNEYCIGSGILLCEKDTASIFFILNPVFFNALFNLLGIIGASSGTNPEILPKIFFPRNINQLNGYRADGSNIIKTPLLFKIRLNSFRNGLNPTL